MPDAPSRAELAAARGRKVGSIVYGIAVGAFTAVCAVQIMIQVWGSPSQDSTSGGCREGLDRLIGAVRRARQAAGAEPAGERAALARFRTELRPEWTSRPVLAVWCRDDPKALRALRDVDRFRYAEEHAIRYESVDLARHRRRVGEIERRLAEIRHAPGAEGLPE